MPSNGAWVDNWDSTFPGERSSSNTCNGWTVSAANSSGGAFYVNASGSFTDSYQSFSNTGCQETRSLACCFSARRRTFRGFTGVTFAGNLGGRVGAHALCASAFAGSHLCDEHEYTNAETGAAVPSGGAWIDNWDPTFPGERSSSNTCNGWTVSAANVSGGAYYVNASGYFTDSYQSFSNTGCQTARSLACCD